MATEPRIHDIRYFGHVPRAQVDEILARHCRDRGELPWEDGETVIFLPDGKSLRSIVLTAPPPPPPASAPVPPETDTPDTAEAGLAEALGKTPGRYLKDFAARYGLDVVFARGMTVAQKRDAVLDAWRARQTQ